MSNFYKRHQTAKMVNRKYRQWYLENAIPKNYSPTLHASFNILTLLSCFIIQFSFIKTWSLSFLLIFFFTLALGNLVVVLIHRYPLHRRLKLWPFPYDAHTVDHHRFYTSDNVLFENPREIFVVMFPWYVVLGFAVFAQPFFYFSTYWFLGTDLAHFFAGCCAAYFVLYEFVHFTNHLREDHWLVRLPWLKQMREHHRIHHNPKLMHNYNMGIVFPFVDYLMGTKFKGVLPEDKIEDHFKNLEENAN